MNLSVDLFDALQEGMTYEEVLEVMGECGELISQESAQIEPGIKLMEQITSIYEWRDEDDHAIRLMFVRDNLHEKTQHGLEA